MNHGYYSLCQLQFLQVEKPQFSSPPKTIRLPLPLNPPRLSIRSLEPFSDKGRHGGGDLHRLLVLLLEGDLHHLPHSERGVWGFGGGFGHQAAASGSGGGGGENTISSSLFFSFFFGGPKSKQGQQTENRRISARGWDLGARGGVGGGWVGHRLPWLFFFSPKSQVAEGCQGAAVWRWAGGGGSLGSSSVLLCSSKQQLKAFWGSR